MSEPLRIAAAVEGPTDAIVLEAILKALLPDTDFEFQTLQPEGIRCFRLCAVQQHGRRMGRSLSLEPSIAPRGRRFGVRFFGTVVSRRVDRACGCGRSEQDVRQWQYSRCTVCRLACEEPCPPPDKTTNALRAVVLNWLGERECPPRIVLCTPSKSIETWVLAAVCPKNNVVRRDDWECHPNPEGQLAALPKRRRFEKRPEDYRRRQCEIKKAWPQVSARLMEAARFEEEFLAAIRA